jgi:hypothetical protein
MAVALTQSCFRRYTLCGAADDDRPNDHSASDPRKPCHERGLLRASRKLFPLGLAERRLSASHEHSRPPREMGTGRRAADDPRCGGSGDRADQGGLLD